MALPRLRRRRWARVTRRVYLLGLVLVALTGATALFAGRQVWALRHHRAAERAVGRRDFAAAREHLARCLEVWSSSAETHFEAARVARRAEDYDDAERELRDAQRLGWAEEAIQLEHALARVQRGETLRDEAPLVDYLRDHAADDDPEVPIILEAFSRGYLRSYRLLEARGALTRWIECDPGDAQAYLWRGWVRQRLRDSAGAEQDYHRAVDLDPARDDARIRLAEALLRIGKPTAALEQLLYLRGRLPGNLVVAYQLAVCRHELGQLTEARAELDELLAHNLADVQALARRTPPPREPDAEEERWRGVVSLAPYDQRHFGYVTTLFVLTLIERARLAESVEQREPFLRQALTLAPQDEQVNYQLYQCLNRLGKPDADEYLHRWDRIKSEQVLLGQAIQQVTQSPHDPEPRCRAAEVFLRSGQLQEAVRWLESALREDPNYGAAHQLLARYYEQVGDRGGARRERQLAGGAPGP